MSLVVVTVLGGGGLDGIDICCQPFKTKCVVEYGKARWVVLGNTIMPASIDCQKMKHTIFLIFIYIC